MIDLISEIGQKSKLLDAAVQELGKRGRSYAQSERNTGSPWQREFWMNGPKVRR